MSIREEHPLIKSVGLNLAFAIVIVGSSFVLLNSVFTNLGKRLSDLNNAAYVASVGSVEMDGATASIPDSPKDVKELSLPFSDEVLVSPGSKTNSVIVQPVFKTGPGGSISIQSLRLQPVLRVSNKQKRKYYFKGFPLWQYLL